MKFILLAAAISAFSLTASAGTFNCGNPQQKKWTTYYCLSGQVTDANKLENVEFGTCEGSVEAEEAEPVDVFELGTVLNDKSLAATSTEWKNAYSYDLSTDLGAASLYIKAESFNSAEYGSVVRLKINEGGKLKDVRLTCSSFK